MKKIYSKTVFQYNSKTGAFDLDENESQYHFIDDDAPIALMKGGGSSGGGGGGGTSVVRTEPWSGQKPYLDAGLSQMNEFFLKQPLYNAEFDPLSQQAQQGILGAAGDNTLSDSTRDMINKTLRGDYLTGGEGFNSALDAAKNQIIPQVQSGFESRGRAASGLAKTAESGAIGDAFAKLYEQERQNQLRAGQMAPSIDEMKYGGYDRENQIGEDRRKFAEYNANARRNAILQYMGGIQGNYGSNVSSTAPNTGLSGWQRYLAGAGGGALAGAPLGPWGMAAGGALGLLGAYQ